MNGLRKLIKKNRVFIMLIIIVGLISFFMYKTFTKKTPIKDNDLYITSSVELKSNDLDESKKTVVDAKQKKKITILIKNNFSSEKKVFIWYKVIDSDKVKVGNLSSSRIKLSKDGIIVDEAKSYEIEIGIKNNLDISTNVEFGIIYIDTNKEIDNINNYMFINDIFKIGSEKSLTIGDKVILKDDSIWHVIEDSDSSEVYMILLKDDVIKLDNNTDILDIKNNMVLHETSEENISFYLDNNYRKILEDSNIKIGEDGEIRLITLSELQTIGEYEYKDYNYYAKNVPDWLVINNPWWTMTPFSNDSHYYVKNENILSIKDVKKVRASIRPVIKILKSNIK